MSLIHSKLNNHSNYAWNTFIFDQAMTFKVEKTWKNLDCLINICNFGSQKFE